ncbi:hypothetical protein O181_018935 [Austropuccinia psidii MF-1]|uniref:Integrase catalytic domain-containing protein n=1 Tax=Austropuccinia psidii MF-1 TaxID=1389203 RepID=A0A9Q3CAT0_9BASI|nr:hypothetical protein [Austropuccinia psidii MF-1]
MQKRNQQAHTMSSPEKKIDTQDNSESYMYYLPIEGFITDHQDRSQKIYLESGCGQSVINNLSLLKDPKPRNMSVKTFGNNDQITHHSTLNFFGFDIFPVSYAPQGQVNLISVSQLIDHGLKPIYKNDVFSIKCRNSIVATFQQDGNLHSTQSPTNVAWYSSPRSFISSKNCEVCCISKIERHPHKRSLPTTSSPFYKLYTDIFEINVPSKKGCRYILAIVDDFSRFNRIVFLKSIDQTGREIISFINKIRNKLNKDPAFLHSDQGGEFTSNSFLFTLKKEGVSIKQGAPHSPQTNGVAEQFNRSLLSKIRCLRNKLNIPVSYWDQAATHASLLLNNTPHWFLNMMTPANCLENHNSPIEPSLDFSRLISFGSKLNVKNKSPDSKVTGGSPPLCALTFERYSDLMRFLNIDNGRIKISRDYIPSINDKPVKVCKLTQSLPSETIQLTFPKPISSNITLSMDQIEVSDSTSNNAPHPVDNEFQLKAPGPKKKCKYVPYYKKASKDVSSSISTENVTEGSSRKKNNKTFLMDVIPYSQAINDPLEKQEWFNAMQKEFDSLMQHNTSELDPYPRNAKVIGGMWRLTKKQMNMAKCIAIRHVG